MQSDYGINRIPEEELEKEVLMVTSVWAKSAVEGTHPAITIPYEVLHVLRAFWMNTYKENMEAETK